VKGLTQGGSATPAPGPVAPAVPKGRGGGVFVSYSHRDSEKLGKLQTHLAPYIRGKTLEVWDDTKIKPGERWREEIAAALEQATVAVLLVSPDFLESRFIAENELPPLLAAAQDQGLTILWVPLSSSSYDETEIEGYEAVISPDQPLDTMSEADQNKAWVRVCKEIKKAVQG
jgi:internalin A